MASAKTKKLHTMKETCELTGMAYENLKYYCNTGLVPNVKRSANNRRVFDDRNITWIKGLLCLRRCGLSIEEMRRYTELCFEGEPSIPERKQMLADKRARLVEQLAEIRDSIDFIDAKQRFYDDVLSGATPYVSVLIPSAALAKESEEPGELKGWRGNRFDRAVSSSGMQARTTVCCTRA